MFFSLFLKKKVFKTETSRDAKVQNTQNKHESLIMKLVSHFINNFRTLSKATMSNNSDDKGYDSCTTSSSSDSSLSTLTKFSRFRVYDASHYVIPDQHVDLETSNLDDLLMVARYFPDDKFIWVMDSKFASVYTDIFRRFVLKKFKPYVNRTFIQSEILAASKLKHANTPYVCKVHESRYNWMIMDYGGVDAMELLNDRKINFYNWIKAVEHLYKGVNYLHQQDLIHCDLKLENVVFNDNTLKWQIIDFGLVGQKGTPFKITKGTEPYIYTLRADEGPNHLMNENVDRFSYALIIIFLAGILFDECCNECKAKNKNCSFSHHDKYNHGKTYRRINIQKLYDIRFGRTCQTNDAAHMYSESKMDFLDDHQIVNILRCVTDIVLSYLDNSKKFIIWETLETYSYYQDNMFYHKDDKLWGVEKSWDYLGKLII